MRIRSTSSFFTDLYNIKSHEPNMLSKYDDPNMYTGKIHKNMQWLRKYIEQMKGEHVEHKSSICTFTLIGSDTL